MSQEINVIYVKSMSHRCVHSLSCPYPIKVVTSFKVTCHNEILDVECIHHLTNAPHLDQNLFTSLSFEREKRLQRRGDLSGLQ